MRKALLFVIVVAMVATGLWFVAGLFFRNRSQHLVRRQWRVADRFGRRPVVEGLRRALLGLRRSLNDVNNLTWGTLARTAHLVTRDEARRIAANVAKLSRGCSAGRMDSGAPT
jgi:hypothetical protein